MTIGIDIRGARLIRQSDLNNDGVEDRTYAYQDAQGKTQVATDFSRHDARGQVQPPDGLLTQEDAFEQQRAPPLVAAALADAWSPGVARRLYPAATA